MPAEVRHFVATIPAGTAEASPVTVSVSFPPRVVVRVDWRVPKGPMGTMGWLLAMGGVAVMPQPAGTYVVADGEHSTWHLDGQPDSGSWQVIGYNTGSNPHSVYLAFHCDLVERAAQLRQPIAYALLAESPDLSRAGAPVRGTA